MNNAIEISTLEDKKLPGDLAMWFFILAELTVFAIFFISFAVTEQLNPEMFSQGKAQLHPVAGLINTLALITSSFFVALALNAIHQGKRKVSVSWLITAQAFAILYLIVKMWEYQSLFNVGISLETNTFFTLYFLITAFHFLHVILGMIILSYITFRTYKGAYRSNVSGFEAGASYWHMVDLLWIILFPLIYVI
ncbi:cytochrome c oxidase subunit 3 family protein [Colwellia sp. 1_MG-2023]|uniref:cytochrome c oxidase subunit 3 family protein n=1 Tax=Colwellia sp. 1_MG-2023 TaxID=3062649 RepID=UPI0026E180AD|nr:cytochrome c oxidase subunit 3 family protein [Colwellia sp. 1_MG-2023]MDO6444461.1 cytochrome c oxidase subunit 3 family protein [Colwellia sp. 1_MG-2023]